MRNELKEVNEDNLLLFNCCFALVLDTKESTVKWKWACELDFGQDLIKHMNTHAQLGIRLGSFPNVHTT